MSTREYNGVVFSKATRNENNQHSPNICQVWFQERDVLDDADTKPKSILTSLICLVVADSPDVEWWKTWRRLDKSLPSVALL
jgi:hypothetical protein